jgi:hypothetical protein
MKERSFLFYSLPGAILVLGVLLALVYKPRCITLSTDIVALAVFASPVAGFVIHELWRIIFEIELRRIIFKFIRIQDQPQRPVIAELLRQFPALNGRKAFSVWIQTVYGFDIPQNSKSPQLSIPDALRDLIASNWTFIHTTGACAVSCFIGSFLILLLSDTSSLWFLLSFPVLFAAFLLKTVLTYLQVGAFEVATVRMYRGKIEQVVKQMLYMN